MFVPRFFASNRLSALNFVFFLFCLIHSFINLTLHVYNVALRLYPLGVLVFFMHLTNKRQTFILFFIVHPNNTCTTYMWPLHTYIYII